jgi:hypothetical protein
MTWPFEKPVMRFWPNPSTGQFTTVAVFVTVTSPAFSAASTSAAERRRRGVAEAFQVTMLTCHNGE